MRDYYDIYLIYIKEWDNVNKDNLRKAIKNTFDKREFEGQIPEILDMIENDDNIKRMWNIYSKKMDYANDIEFDVILSYIEEIVSVMELIEV